MKVAADDPAEAAVASEADDHLAVVAEAVTALTVAVTEATVVAEASAAEEIEATVVVAAVEAAPAAVGEVLAAAAAAPAADAAAVATEVAANRLSPSANSYCQVIRASSLSASTDLCWGFTLTVYPK